MYMKRKLFSLMISTGNYQKFVKGICGIALDKKSSYVCLVNVHMMVEAHKSPSFATVVNNADITTPDGMPLVKSLNWFYKIRQERVAGMDLLPDLLRESEEQNIPVFFYGSTTDIISKTVEHIREYFPKLHLAGSYSPPFRPLTIQEEEQIIKTINRSGARLVFVALGCPKQEKWMASMKGRIEACMVGIGGALPVLTGFNKRAPRWMQNACLEWLYRLMQEPRRLIKRYAVTNTIFMFLLLKAWVRLKIGKTQINLVSP